MLFYLPSIKTGQLSLVVFTGFINTDFNGMKAVCIHLPYCAGLFCLYSVYSLAHRIECVSSLFTVQLGVPYSTLYANYVLKYCNSLFVKVCIFLL
jgi:hypothetical protein